MFSYWNKLIIDIALALFSALILKKYFDIFFKTRESGFIKHFCWILYGTWQIMIEKSNVFPAYVNVIISIVLVSIVCAGAFEGHILQKIVFSVLINAIWMQAEFLVGYGFILCGINYMVPQLLGSLLSKCIIFFIILCLRKFFHNKNIRNLSNRHNLILLLIPIGSMFVIYNVFMLSVELNQDRHIKASWTSLIIMLLINITIFRLYLSLSKEKELQKYNTVYEQQLELCNQHMLEKETVMMDFRNARHDMKQHFIILIELLNKNENQNAIEYLQNLINMSPLSQLGISRTDNIVIDSLVNAKYAVAMKEQIRFETDIHIPMRLPFRSADLCILLGNILDNAIEASLALDEERRYIGFFMKYEGNILVITVINSYNGEILRDSRGKIITNKGNAGYHGIGLESVKKVAEKYSGSVVIEPQKEKFIIKIILCDLSKKLQVNS